MRLNNYLNESPIDVIEKDCQPMIQFYKRWGCNSMLSRIERVTRDDLIVKKIPRKDRKAMDTPAWLSKMVNDALYKRFGWHPRSEGVFAWYRKGVETTQMSMYFYPIGEFKYIWSQKVQDLYIHWVDSREDFLSDKDWATLKSQFPKPSGIGPDNKDVKQWVEDVADSYVDHSLKNNHNNHETIIKCDAYYLIEGFYNDIVIKELIKK